MLKILLFFGIVALVDFGFGLACGWLESHARGGMTKRIHEITTLQKADVVIMGSSRAHHHYVSSILSDSLGVTAYNAGVDGNGIVLGKGLYAMLAKRYTPKVIIYDVEPTFDINVYAEDGNNTRYIGQLRPYCQDSQVKEVITRVDASEEYKDLSAMFRYNSKIFDMIKDYATLGDYTSDGFAPMFGEMKKEPEKIKEGVKAQIDSLKLCILEEFVVELSKSDTRLIMMASPKYGATSSEMFEPVKAICNKHGVEFWDLYCESEFQKLEYFKEPMHLNEKGADVFSKAIAKRVRTGDL